MYRKILIGLATLTFALGILFVSVLRSAAVKYEFDGNHAQVNPQVLGDEASRIDYFLAYPGRVLPDSPLWPLKALRDRIWLWITTDSGKKAELKLLFADKRLGSAKILLERGKPEEGITTLTKAEKYLEEASNLEEENRREGMDTAEFLQRLAKASLKHFEVMSQMSTIAPEEARPAISQIQDYAKRAYEHARNALLEKGKVPPENPFEW